jgi:integrase
MGVELRGKGKNIYYSVQIYDPEKGKNYRFPKAETFHLKSKEAAEEFQRKKEAEFNSSHVTAKRRFEWLNKFERLADKKLQLDEFAKWRVDSSRNNWENDVLLLKNFVFKYFLDVAKLNNPRDWSHHYGMFKKWLGEQEPFHRRKAQAAKLAINTCNNVIRALNAYMTYLEEDQESGFHYKEIPRCSLIERIGDRKQNKKSILNVLREDESSFVFNQLRMPRNPSPRRQGEEGYQGYIQQMSRMNQLHAYFFKTMLETGLRINECVGLSLENVVFSPIENDTLKRALNSEGIEHYGFINLKDQPNYSSLKNDKTKKSLNRNSKGHVPRKPLKGRAAVGPEFNRIIPIMSEDLAKILVELFNEQAALFKKRHHGPHAKKHDYILFEGVTKNSFSGALREVYQSDVFGRNFRDILEKTSHDLRHTFCTRMVAKTKGNPFLAKHILGHSDFKMVENYSHIWQQIVNDQKVNEQIESLEDLTVEKLRKF